MSVDPALINSVYKIFETTFHNKPTYLVQAPGRVNLIGEYTDINQGFVLPCAINFHTVVAIRSRKDNYVRVVAIDFDLKEDLFNLKEKILYNIEQPWANYIRGVLKCLLDKGHSLGGADLVISGNIPQGAGLSSSASLEVAIAEAFNKLFSLNMQPQEIALSCQQAENDFVGCNCGIMDQLISVNGKKGHALLIDCRSLETTPIPLPNNYSILIINSNKKRELVSSAYNERRQQCERAANFFSVPALRDLDMATFESRKQGLSDTIARKARHVISENERSIATAFALQSSNMLNVQKFMRQSHASMRDDFEITVSEIDTLVDIIKSKIGSKGGVRMTGGGFGGCVVALIPNEQVNPVKLAVIKEYPDASNLEPDIFVCSACEGAGTISFSEVPT